MSEGQIQDFDPGLLMLVLPLTVDGKESAKSLWSPGYYISSEGKGVRFLD